MPTCPNFYVSTLLAFLGGLALGWAIFKRE